MRRWIILSVLFFGLGGSSRAQYASPVLVAGSGSAKVLDRIVDFSIGEMTMVESFVAPGLMLSQGFLQVLEGGSVWKSDIVVLPSVSPNQDGKGNEVLTILNIEKYPDNEIEIFNRWGTIVFKTKGYDNLSNVFTGKANSGLLIDNQDLPDGTYFYVLKVKDPSFPVSPLVLNGFIVIKRQ